MTVPLSEGEVPHPTHTPGSYDYRGTAYAGNAEYGISRTYINQYGGFFNDKYTLNKVYNTEGYTDGTIISDETNYRYGIRYNYYRRDHLGNNREVWTTEQVNYSGTIPAFTSQRTQYYPSGLPWAEGTGASVQNKKYNGKEFIEAHGLDEYNSQARMYYPAIMRTTTIDPLAEKYYSISPYAWCGNNPVNAIDPDGRQVLIGGPALTNGLQRITAFVVNNSDLQDIFILGSAVVAGITGGEPKQFAITTNDNGQINGVKILPATSDDVNVAKEGLLLPVVSGTAVKNVEKAARMTENAAKGKAFEKQVGKSLGNNKASQVTIEAADGTRTKVDFVQKNGGKVTLTEAKGSQTAPLTPNQKKAHPQIEQSGGTVRGNKGTTVGLPNGKKIPPTKVEIIRPKYFENR